MFDLLTARSNLLPDAFVWALYIYMGEMLRIHISIIQLNQNLMMSIRALMRHKIAKWADRKSKMATTAAILKINFRHVFSNLRSLWAETCSLATGWLLKQDKIVSIEIQRWPQWFCSIEQDGRQSCKIENLQTTSRPWPVAWFQNICHKCSTNGPQPKLLKWLRWAEQNGGQS